MIYGYARSVDRGHELRFQIEQLHKFGVDRTFVDEDVSGSAVWKRGLEELIECAVSGDVLVISNLAVLARSMTLLMSVLLRIDDRGLGLRSLKEGISSEANGGLAFFAIVRALRDFETAASSERRFVELRQAGTSGGRRGRPALIPDGAWSEARQRLDGPEPISVAALAAELNVSRQAIYKRLKSERLLNRPPEDR